MGKAKSVSAKAKKKLRQQERLREKEKKKPYININIFHCNLCNKNYSSSQEMIRWDEYTCLHCFFDKNYQQLKPEWEDLLTHYINQYGDDHRRKKCRRDNCYLCDYKKMINQYDFVLDDDIKGERDEEVVDNVLSKEKAE